MHSCARPKEYSVVSGHNELMDGQIGYEGNQEQMLHL
jgi:hypothetical protein